MPFAVYLLIGLLTLAIVSPLLTFSALFQQKEWRWDRLREHLRRDGWWNQLFGSIRPPLLALFFLWQVYDLAYPINAPIDITDDIAYAAFMKRTAITSAWIILFAILSAVQIIFRKQRVPVWTSKSLLIVLLSIVLGTGTMIAGLIFPITLPFILLLQPIVVVISWIILKPLDWFLKKRVMDRSAAYRSSLNDTTVIGIAGSVGKTTVKELIAHLLQDLHPLTTPAHVNTEMGVAQWLIAKRAVRGPEALRPEWEERKEKKEKLFIIEMGAYAKGEIALLCKIAQPTIGVLTALGSDHLALFGSEEAITQANGELIAALPADGHAFIYGDNAACQSLAKHAPCPVTLTGSKALEVTKIIETSNGIQFLAPRSHVLRGEVGSFFIPLHGLHSVHNALLAIGVARHLGIDDKRIAELLQTFKAPAHTFNVRNEHGITLLDDTYNISPLSMRAALDWLGAQKHRPRVLYTSGLQETGPEEARFLKELGAHAKGKVERVVFSTKHGSDYFAEGFGQPIDILSASTARVTKGSILACVGRMPLSSIQRMLPLN